MGYKHLNIDERESILKMRSEQKNITLITELIGRNKGTISRELSRNRSSTGDTVAGKSRGSFVATHVERKSRYLLVGRTDDKSAESMNATTRRLFRRIPKSKRKTMTFDNGKDFAGFKALEKSVGFCCYFADPYSSYQRGTNENTNGLLRQFFSKGTDFNEISDEEIDKAAALLNNNSRKSLNYRTPHEVLWSGLKFGVI
jgi:transposase, IS30 family